MCTLPFLFNMLYLKLIIVDCSFLQQIWESSKRAFYGLSVSRPESVALFPDRQSSSVVVVGENEEVNSLQKKVKNIIDDLEEKQAIKNEFFTKSLPLRHYELVLFRSLRLVDKVKTPGITVTVCSEDRSVEIKVIYHYKFVQDSSFNFDSYLFTNNNQYRYKIAR